MRHSGMSVLMSRLFLAIGLAMACVAPAWTAGPIEIRRDKLPKPMARLHTCVKPTDKVQISPVPTPVDGSGVIFDVSCPVNGEGVRAPQAAASLDDQQLALYLARNKAGTGARRLSFDYPQADGQGNIQAIAINVVPAGPSIGWSTRAHTSKLNGAAFLDMQRRRLPPGEFHLLMSFKPADRPHLKGAIAIWRVTKRGNTKLIYWAETTEELRGENPHWIYPHYTVVLDQRPER